MAEALATSWSASVSAAASAPLDEAGVVKKAKITMIKVPLDANTQGGGTATLALYATGTDGLPTGSALVSQTVTVPSTAGPVTWGVGGFPVKAGVTYAFTIENAAPKAFWLGSSTPAAFTSNAMWAPGQYMKYEGASGWNPINSGKTPMIQIDGVVV
jgi:hypothetical protein